MARSPPSSEEPQVILGEDKGKKYFYMVQGLKGTCEGPPGHALAQGGEGRAVPAQQQHVGGNQGSAGAGADAVGAGQQQEAGRVPAADAQEQDTGHRAGGLEGLVAGLWARWWHS